MTAHELIADIFRRPQAGVASNMRVLSRAQLDYLANLIGEDEEGGALERGRGLSFIWMPSGRDKYVVTEDPRAGKRHTILRLSNIAATSSGKLF